MDPSDDHLIARFREGDAGAFAELVRRWDRRVYVLAYRVTGDAEDAGDVRQMAFMRAYGALGSFNGQAAFSTWLYRVVLNLCRDRLRSQRARTRHVGAVSALREGAGPEASSSAVACERRELTRRVADAVASLPRAERLRFKL